MIEVLIADGKTTTIRSPFNRGDLLEALAGHGLAHQRVESATGAAIVLCFAPLRSALVEGMSAELRRQTIIVDEDGRSYAPVADEIRSSSALLGLIEASAWSKWRHGLLVAWGVYGRDEIATRAGLSSFPGIGLQPKNERLALPDTLASYLRACQLHLDEVDAGGTGSSFST